MPSTLTTPVCALGCPTTCAEEWCVYRGGRLEKDPLPHDAHHLRAHVSDWGEYIKVSPCPVTHPTSAAGLALMPSFCFHIQHPHSTLLSSSPSPAPFTSPLHLSVIFQQEGLSLFVPRHPVSVRFSFLCSLYYVSVLTSSHTPKPQSLFPPIFFSSSWVPKCSLSQYSHHVPPG